MIDHETRMWFHNNDLDLTGLDQAGADELRAYVENIPSHITDPVDDGSGDPLYGTRMDDADLGRN